MGENNKNDKAIKDLIFLMYETSLLSCGFSLEAPATHANRIHRMISLGLGNDGDGEKKEDADDEEMPELEEDADDDNNSWKKLIKLLMPTELLSSEKFKKYFKNEKSFMKLL